MQLDGKDLDVMVEHRNLRKQRDRLLDTCDSYVEAEFIEAASEIEKLGEQILERLIDFF